MEELLPSVGPIPDPCQFQRVGLTETTCLNSTSPDYWTFPLRKREVKEKLCWLSSKPNSKLREPLLDRTRHQILTMKSRSMRTKLASIKASTRRRSLIRLETKSIGCLALRPRKNLSPSPVVWTYELAWSSLSSRR